MDDWLGLSGSRVLIAGAGGLGGAIAGGFSNAGAQITIVDSSPATLAALDVSLSLTAQGHECIVADLLEHGTARALVGAIVDKHGGIDVFVHCVGVNDRRPILELSEMDWTRIWDVNLRTAVRLGTEVGREMVCRRAGRIVMISSVAGLLAHRNHAPYATSKGGLNQLVRSMASEWAAYGVRANAIAPGYIETPLTAEHLAKPGVRSDLERLIPAGRLGTVDQVTGPTLFLASRQAEFINGQVIYVDGGRTLV